MAKTQAELQALAAPDKMPKSASLSAAKVNPVYEEGGRRVTELGEKIKPKKVVEVGKGWSSFVQQRMVATEFNLKNIAKYLRQGGSLTEQAILDLSEDLAQMENYVRGSERSVRAGTGSATQRQPGFVGRDKNAIVHLSKSLEGDLKEVLKAVNKHASPSSTITTELVDDLAGKGQSITGEKRIANSVERMKVSISRLIDPNSQIFGDDVAKTIPRAKAAATKYKTDFGQSMQQGMGDRLERDKAFKEIKAEKTNRSVVKDWSPRTALKASAHNVKNKHGVRIQKGTTKIAAPLLAGFSESTPDLRAQAQARHQPAVAQALPEQLPRPAGTKYGSPFGQAMQGSMRTHSGGIPGTPLGNAGLAEGIIGEAGQGMGGTVRPESVQKLPPTLPKTQLQKNAAMGASLENRHLALGEKLKKMGIKLPKGKGGSAKMLPIILALGLLGMMGKE